MLSHLYAGNPAMTAGPLTLRGTARLVAGEAVLVATPQAAGRDLPAADRDVLLAALLIAGFDPLPRLDPAGLGTLPVPAGWAVLADLDGRILVRDSDGGTLATDTGTAPDGWSAALARTGRLRLVVVTEEGGGPHRVCPGGRIGATLPVRVVERLRPPGSAERPRR